MYVRDLFASLLRRWYLVLVGLLVTSLAGGLVHHSVAPRYEAQASVVLVPPNTIAPTAANPLLYLGSLTQALQVLVRSLDSDETQQTIRARNPGATFSVVQDTTTSGPILLVVAQAADAGGALAELKTVLGAVGTQLRGVQHDLAVTTKNRIGRLDLSVDSTATPLTKARTRAVLSVGALGALLTLLLTGAADSVILRRRRRSAAQSVPVAEGSAEDAASAIDSDTDGDAPAATPVDDPPARVPAPAAAELEIQGGAEGGRHAERLGQLVELGPLRRTGLAAPHAGAHPAAGPTFPRRPSAVRPKPWSHRDAADHQPASSVDGGRSERAIDEQIARGDRSGTG
jgi:hypothetical protein